MSEHEFSAPKPVQLRSDPEPEMAAAARESWQPPIRESYGAGVLFSDEEARILSIIKAANAAAELRARGFAQAQNMEDWALEKADTSKGRMSRLEAFGELDTAEEVSRAIRDRLVALSESD